DGKELRFPLFRNRLSIGRTAHNDIQLQMSFVSRRHAVIATDNERTRIIDWGSRNGVYVNKKRVTECMLQSGDVITIGLTELRYEERTKS
ncbi:MAG: FHA domain-containing protein, partial [Gammaproteobacteria bacterium]|nr:FHA domain-containing protein [Gammaproteobacteria bacterium]